MAFTTLILEEKELEVLGEAIKSYTHLRNINLNKNQLSSLNELTSLPNLLTLTAVENQVDDISFLSQDSNPNLQVLRLTLNKVKILPPLAPIYLKHVILNENEVESCSGFKGHQNIEILELRKNKLINCDGIGNMPNLRELYLAENPLVSISHLHTLPNLEKLNIRATELEVFDEVPELPCLEYLNLRESKIATLEEVKKLETLKNMTYVNLLGTPVGDELADGIKKEFILAFPNHDFETVNKEKVTDEDHTEAEELKQERIKEEEEARRAAEAEAEGENQGDE